jgi:CBS domain-containing protein
MNIAYFLKAKSEVAFLYDDFTLRQGLETMWHNGYTAIPVLTRDNKYIGTVTEGDFLWLLINDEKQELHKTDMKDMEDRKIRDAIIFDKNPSVHITATIEELLLRAMDQNFIPVVDDRDYFIGIVTRRDIIKHFYEEFIKKGNPNNDAQ